MLVTSRLIPDSYVPLPAQPSSRLARIIEKIQQIASLFARFICCRLAGCLGYIVNGNVDNKQLATRLSAAKICDIVKNGVRVDSTLSIGARDLIHRTYQKLNQSPEIYDIHMHILGYDSDNFLHPNLDKGLSGIKWSVIHNAATGAISAEGSTNLSIERLQIYARHFPKLKGTILPIHCAWDQNGKPEFQNTASYLGNSTAVLAAQGQESLQPAVSIHPKDPDWKLKMEHAAVKGIRLIKWYPPQGVNPTDNCKEFYSEMVKNKMVLIAHSGHSHALSLPKQWEHFGDPENFKEALEAGVDVILAHCGGEERIDQFEKLGAEAKDKNWKGKLYGDLSGATHKSPTFLARLMDLAQKPHINIVYGSDYPYTNLGKARYNFYATQGWLKKNEVEPLNEIRQANPLLANFIAMSILTIKGNQFPIKTFTTKIF